MISLARRQQTTETPEEALQRIQSLGFGNNDALAIMSFADRGIPADDIDPRNNVLTFNAWKAKGRSVAKGAISVRVTTWIPCKPGAQEEPTPEPAPEGTAPKKRGGSMRPKLAYLFHESQTIPQHAPKGTRPAAWANPLLIRPGTYDNGQDFADQVVAAALEAEAAYPASFDGIRTPDDFGAQGTDRPETCDCPMVGCITNVNCPLHGTKAPA